MKKNESIDIKSIDIVKAGALALTLGLAGGCSVSPEDEQEQEQKWYTVQNAETGLSCRDISEIEKGEFGNTIGTECGLRREYDEITGIPGKYKIDMTSKETCVAGYSAAVEDNKKRYKEQGDEEAEQTVKEQVVRSRATSKFMAECGKEQFKNGLRGQDVVNYCEEASENRDDTMTEYGKQKLRCEQPADSLARYCPQGTDINDAYYKDCKANLPRNIMVSSIQPVADSIKNVAMAAINPITELSCNNQGEFLSQLEKEGLGLGKYCNRKVVYDIIVKENRDLGELGMGEGGYLYDMQFECEENPEISKLFGNGRDTGYLAYSKKRTECAQKAFAEGLRGNEINTKCDKNREQYSNEFWKQNDECYEMRYMADCLNTVAKGAVEQGMKVWDKEGLEYICRVPANLFELEEL